jgi:hypothetical protein
MAVDTATSPAVAVELFGHGFTHSLPAAIQAGGPRMPFAVSALVPDRVNAAREKRGHHQRASGAGGRWRGTRSVLTLQSWHDAVSFCDILEAGRLHFSHRHDLGSTTTSIAVLIIR